MKITLLTMGSDSILPMTRITAPNKLEYCLKYGLQFSLKKYTNIKQIHLEKYEFILSSLQECDWLWFMGIDTLIMNYNTNVETFLDNKYDFIIGKDIQGINNDVFFLKNTYESKLFINELIMRMEDYGDDQEAMIVIKDKIPEFKYKIVPQKLFNAYLYEEEACYSIYPRNKDGIYEGNYESGDFILHFPGIEHIRREFLVNKYSNKVIKN